MTISQLRFSGFSSSTSSRLKGVKAGDKVILEITKDSGKTFFYKEAEFVSAKGHKGKTLDGFMLPEDATEDEVDKVKIINSKGKERQFLTGTYMDSKDGLTLMGFTNVFSLQGLGAELAQQRKNYELLEENYEKSEKENVKLKNHMENVLAWIKDLGGNVANLIKAED